MRIRIEPERLATTFAAFSDDPALRESAQLFVRGLPLPEMLQAMSMNENVMRAFSALGAVYPNGTLERALAEKVILRVSQLHDCQFCVHAHLELMGQLTIDSDLSTPSGLTERERLAVTYAELMTSDSNRVPERIFDELRAFFSEGEIVELTFLVGLITLLNRFNNALGVRYGGDYASASPRPRA